jgi:putative transposase
MDGSIELTAHERKMLLKAYRSGTDPRAARRAHIVLLRADGLTWEHIRQVLYCSNDLIADTLRAWAGGGVAAVLEPASASTPVPAWLLKVLRWVSQHTPQEFGFFRSRWSCGCLSTLVGESGWKVSAETVRRGLHRLDFVWRRPRPIVGPTDPEYAEKLQGIQDLLAALPGDEVAVFEDEVDIHLNPKIGAMWMRRGEQAVVETPGNNRKCHLAGSLVWGTGTLLVSQPEARRNTELFLAHLDDLRRRLRSWKRIHVICDNAPFHKSRAVRQYLTRWGHRIVLHHLPKYAPETNPIERVWWHMHETITRNHRCHTLEELVRQAYAWFRTNTTYFTEMRRTFAKAAA